MGRSRPQPDDAALVTRAVALACERLTAGSRICVALSGGIDSVVLLHALVHYCGAAPVGHLGTPSAHHVHHGLSAFADEWLAHCATFCASIGVDFTHERVAVDRNSAEGIEAAARAARYASLANVGADVVMLGHHRRDQAETVLLQLLRGAGPEGVAAMPVADGRLLRPLLDVSHAAIERYARQHALSFVHDDSNDDTRFARNRLRHDVWPSLLSAFPSAETTLARAATHQADAAELLRDLAGIDAELCISDDKLRLRQFFALSAVRQANLLRYWLELNAMQAPSTATLHDWLRQLRAPAAGQATELRRKREDHRSVRIYRDEAFVVDDPVRWDSCAWLGEQEVVLRSAERVAGTLRFCPAPATSESAMLRAPAVTERWQIRSRREGDAIRLSQKSGHVSLKNVMQSAGIPPWLRDTWPLVTCNDEVVAVASVTTAKAYTVRAGETGQLCEWKPAWRLPWRP